MLLGAVGLLKPSVHTAAAVHAGPKHSVIRGENVTVYIGSLRAASVRPCAAPLAQPRSQLASRRECCTPAEGKSARAAVITRSSASDKAGAPLTDFAARWFQKLKVEIGDAGVKTGLDRERVEQGVDTLHTLFVDYVPDVEKMSLAEWASMVNDLDGLVNKTLVLKDEFPKTDASALMRADPRVFLKTAEELRTGSQFAKHILQDMRDVDPIIQQIPDLLTPQMLVSVLVTFKRWFPKRDPVDLLEEDPDLLRRSQVNDMPLDPVFFDLESGQLNAPAYNTAGKLLPWQKYIRETIYKKKQNEMETDNTFWSGGDEEFQGEKLAQTAAKTSFFDI